MKTYDYRNLPVSKPIMLAKDILDNLPNDSLVEFIVNCGVSEENIVAYAYSKGFFVKKEEKNESVHLTILKYTEKSI